MKHEPPAKYTTKADARLAADTYLEAEIGEALAADAAFFKAHPGASHRIPKASQSEVRLVQAVERRMCEPTEGMQPIALIHLAEDGRRRRVIVEAYKFDFERMDEDAIAELFADVTGGGWTEIEGGVA